jgi:hypothetical protein
MDVPLWTMFMINAPRAATGKSVPWLANVTTARIDNGARSVFIKTTG